MHLKAAKDKENKVGKIWRVGGQLVTRFAFTGILTSPMYQNPTSCIRNAGENPTCPFCSNRSIKYGSGKRDPQRFCCTLCCRSFLPDYSYLACKTGTDTSIIQHVKESCGICIIAKLVKILATTLLRQIVSVTQKIEIPIMVTGEDYELNELRPAVRFFADYFLILDDFIFF